MLLLISLFDGPQCDSIRKISISRIQWQILCSLNISGKKVLTRGSMPSDDWWVQLWIYIFLSKWGRGGSHHCRTLLDWPIPLMLVSLLNSVQSQVLKLLSCVFGGSPPFNPVWCECLPVFVVNTSLCQLLLQLVFVAPAWSTSVMLAFAEFTKEHSFGHPVVLHVQDIASPPEMLM